MIRWNTRRQSWIHCSQIWDGRTSLLLLLLLLLRRFSRVRLCATPETAAHQAPVPGVLQARTLEWVAISFSNAWKRKVKVKSLSRIRLLATPWTAVYQAPPSMGFSRQEYWREDLFRLIEFLLAEVLETYSISSTLLPCKCPSCL